MRITEAASYPYYGEPKEQMEPPTIGSPTVWPLLAPRMAKYLKSKLGSTTHQKPTDKSVVEVLRERRRLKFKMFQTGESRNH